MSGHATVDALLNLIGASAKAALTEYERFEEGVPSLDSQSSHPLDVVEDSLKLRNAIRTLEGACAQLCSMLAPPVHTISNRTHDTEWLCLFIVIEAKIADVLEKHPKGLHVSELAQAVNMEPGKISRILRFLAANHVFVEVEHDVFANNRLSLVLHSSNPVSSLAYSRIIMLGPSASALYDVLTQPSSAFSYDASKALCPKVFGFDGTYFQWLYSNSQTEFERAMIGVGDVMASLTVVHHFPWTKISTVCDVGSGIGAFALPLLKTHPHLKITLFDLPEAVDQAIKHWDKELPSAIHNGQVCFVKGNFFAAIPSGLDIYYLRNILHSWTNAQAEMILKKLSEAARSDSRVLIHDYVLPSKEYQSHAPAPLLPNYGKGGIRAYYQDMTMLFGMNGKERTCDEFIAIGARAGFRLEKIWEISEAPVLEFRKC